MITLAGHTNCVRCLSYSPDGSLLASGDEDGTLRLWSLKTLEPVQHWNYPDSVETLTFTGDGEYIIAGLAHGILSLVRVVTGKHVWQKVSHEGGVKAVAAHGRQLVTTGWDRTITWWRTITQDNDRITVPLIPSEPASALALSPDGEIAAVAMQTSAQLLLTHHPLTGAFTSVVSYHGPLQALCYSPDGTLLASGSSRGWVELRRPTGHVVREFVGHTSVVYGVCFTPDGRRLISTGGDATSRIWDIASGQQEHVFQWHEHWATCLAIAPDGLTVATGGADQRVIIWDIPD